MKTEIKVFKTINSLHQHLTKYDRATIGFVPTMGYLHEGHISLIKKARRENDIIIMSLFVNPTQFNSTADLAAYPMKIDEDIDMAQAAGCDIVFMPEYAELYKDDFNYKISEQTISSILEGEHRPGHFTGVLTVVMKLINITHATRAYFGEKDFQQLQLVKGMMEAFFVPTEIVACATIRDESGLALSSRNARLTDEQLALAPLFNQVMRRYSDVESVKQALFAAGFNKIDYISDAMGRRHGAVWLGDVRLIDNISLDEVQFN